MKLEQLLEGLEYEYIDASGNVITDEALRKAAGETGITAITNDSRKVAQGGLFFCIVGANSDGHDFADKAAEAGAAALIVQRAPEFSQGVSAPVLVRVADSRYAMAMISAAWFDHPAKKMKMIGVTGTKGKTTTTYLVKSILEHAGISVGLIGTIESTWREGGEEIHIPSANTTPESLTLQTLLDRMQKAGVAAVVMEVSSQALKLGRTAGIFYDLGVFTNISPDHIGPNEHESFEEYLACKGLLFRQCRTGIVNGDDPKVSAVLEGHTCKVSTFGLRPENDLYADHLELVKKPGELGISFDTEGKVQLHAEVPTPGSFSVYNALCAVAICLHFNVEPSVIASALLQAKVKGRIEMVKVSDDFTLMIDYAHNAVALESLLTTLKEYHPHRLITVFGCGGNRSKLRRFEMGEVSGRLSDFTIITSDNPRFEEPEAIIADIVTGISKTDGEYITITDRKEAIAYAIHHGEPGDIIVLAGKGHEDYQEIRGKKYPMDERVIIREILDADSGRSVR
jgi:UDP-N-acetylmuramoyl-L-alanyl-D-glutamate--2,6-diaminopimelate ligase